MNHKFSRIGAVAAGMLLAVAGAAFAGSKFAGSGRVVVTKNSDGSGSAIGYLGHIYNASTTNEYIGCQKYVTGGVLCHALSEARVHATCNSSSVYLGNAVGTLSPDARLMFRWNASGTCIGISITHSSEFQDKQG